MTTKSEWDIDREVCEKATPGPWRWLGHTIGDTPNGRQWFYIEGDSGETQLTNKSPGDIIYDISSSGAVLSSISTGYGGETDIEISDIDKDFIASSRTRWPAALDEIARLKALIDVRTAFLDECH